MEGLGESADRQTDSEKIEGVPSLGEAMSDCPSRSSFGVKRATHPSRETNKEEEPLLSAQHSQESNWVGSLVHRWLKGGETSARILPSGHLMSWSMYERWGGSSCLLLGRRMV